MPVTHSNVPIVLSVNSAPGRYIKSEILSTWVILRCEHFFSVPLIYKILMDNYLRMRNFASKFGLGAADS